MAQLKPDFVPVGNLTEDDINFLVAIGRKQAALMDQLEAALQAQDTLRALDVARELVGLEQQARQT